MINRRLAVRIVLVLAMLLAVVPFTASAANGGPGPSGFRALSAVEARGFTLPSDMTAGERISLDRDGISAERYQQSVGGAKVFGGQLTVLRDAKGGIFAIIGAHYPNLLTTNEVQVSQGQARQIAAGQGDSNGAVSVDLMINPETGRYFYIVENRGFDSRWFHWIDAETGAILNAYDGITHGSGIGVNGDTKDLSGLTTFSGGTYRLQTARQSTYDALQTRRDRNLPGALATDSDDIWDTPGTSSPGQAAMVDAHFYANATDAYYLSTHGFNWLASYSQGMISSAHFSRNYANAFWNGYQMVYGDGDGVDFRELSGDLDVVGHELSHGVTEATSNLVYQNESGALNEAFSDIMGTAIEFATANNPGNWTIGEDINISGDGFRSMSDPTIHGDPSHYGDRYTGTGDNGGVHTNSGIANHWFYLLVNGGQNAKPSRASGTNVQGIGLAAAEQIAFLGFTALPLNANFCAARASTIAVAGNHAANVGDAWNEVGVDEALCGGGGGGGNGPVISNVDSAKVNKRGTFHITWSTDIAADSTVSFTCCGSYNDSALVTSHSMNFNGTKGATYTYYVSSTANGVTTTEGPFTHNN